MGRLIIGVGGTGVEVLNLLAERINQNTKLINKLNKNQNFFWYIDAEKNIPKTVVKGITNISTSLEVLNPAELQEQDYEKDTGFQQWFDPDYRCNYNIGTVNNKGAGQIKLNGRYAFFHNLKIIEAGLNQCQTLDTDTEVFIVSSMFGGTGAGMFLDLAYFIQKEKPKFSIKLHLLDPSFLELAGDSELFSHARKSAYSSYIELDYFLSGHSYSIQHGDYKYQESKAPWIVTLYGGQDKDGKALCPKNDPYLKRKYSNYIAGIMYIRLFSYKVNTHLKANVFNNLLEEPINNSGHFQALVSYGVIQLRFNRLIIENYFKYYAISEFITNNLLLKIKAAKDSKYGNKAVAILKKLKILDGKEELITEDIEKHNKAHIAISAELKNYINSINNADSPDKIRYKNINFDVFTESVEAYFDNIIHGKGKSKSLKSVLMQEFLTLLEPKEIKDEKTGEEIILVDFSLAEVEKIIELMLNNIRSDIERLQPSLTATNPVKMSSVNSAYKLLKKTKKFLFFDDDFEKAKKIYNKTFEQYVKGELEIILNQYIHNFTIEVKKILGEILESIAVIRSILEDTVKYNEILRENLISKFSVSPFFIRTDSDKTLVNHYYIGNYYDFLDSKLIKNSVKRIFNEKERILKSLIIGDSKVLGLKNLLKKLLSYTPEVRNDRETNNEIKDNIQKLIEKYLVNEATKAVNSINYWEVFDEHLHYIYNLMKSAASAKRSDRKNYDKLAGQFSAFLDEETANKLIQSLVDPTNPLPEDIWIKQLQEKLINKLKGKISPIWYIDNERIKDTKKLMDNDVVIEEPLKIADELAVEVDKDAIILLGTIHHYQIHFLEDSILNKFKALYEEHRKVKESNYETPYHLDYRFYNEWDWDVEKDKDEQSDSKLLVYFALGMVMKNTRNEYYIEKVKLKSGAKFVLNLERSYKGYRQINIGKSLPKALNTLLSNNELKNRFTQILQDHLDSIISSRDKNRLDTLIESLQKSLNNWRKLKPPKTQKSQARDYWDKGVSSVESIMKKMDEKNMEKLLL